MAPAVSWPQLHDGLAAWAGTATPMLATATMPAAAMILFVEPPGL
jgi:hypothetical protein